MTFPHRVFSTLSLLTLSIWLGCGTLLFGVARGEPMAPELLQRVKASTVYIKTGTSTGSGFLIHAQGGRLYAVTNYHVLVSQGGGISHSVDVVLNSGEDTEIVQRARVVAADAGDDLAVLEFASPRKAPPLIDMARAADPVEMMSVHALGYPFGDSLSVGERNPGLSVSSGTLSLPRKDTDGNLTSLQLNLTLNPGNSGGPVVDDQGRIVGVAVSTIRGAQISWAIPAEKLIRLCESGVLPPRLALLTLGDGRRKLEIHLPIHDPFRSIQAASVQMIPVVENAGAAANLSAGLTITLQKESPTRAVASLFLPDSLASAEEWDVQLSYSQPGLGKENRLPVFRVKVQELPKRLRDSKEVPALEALLGPSGTAKILLPAHEFVLNPETGDILTLHESDLSLGLYRRQDLLRGGAVTPAARKVMERLPISAAHKRFRDQSFFLVLCRNDPFLHVLDANTLDVIDRIPLGTENPETLAVPADPAIPHLYFVENHQTQRSLSEVNLETRELKSKRVERTWHEFTASPDAALLYGRNKHNGPSSAGLLFMNPLFQGREFIEIQRILLPCMPFVPDPHHVHIAEGKNLYSKDMSRRLGQFDFHVMTFVPDRAVVAGLEGDEFRLASLYTHETIARARLPDALQKRLRQEQLRPSIPEWQGPPAPGNPLRMLADRTSGHIFLGQGPEILSLPLSLFDLPAEPLLTARLSGWRPVSPGENLLFPVDRPRDSLQVTYEGLPSCLTPEGDALRAHPQPTDVGVHSFILRLSENGVSVEIPMRFEVAHRSIPVDFQAEGVAVHPDGNLAFLWSEIVNGESSVALIDLRKRETLHTSKVPHKIRNAFLRGNEIHVLPAKPWLQILRVPDLEPVARIQFPADTASMQENGNTILVRLATGQPLLFTPETRSLQDPFLGDRQGPLEIEALGEGWRVAGVRISPDGQTPERIFNAQNEAFDPLTNTFEFPKGAPKTVTTRNRSLGHSLQTDDGRVLVANLPDGALFLPAKNLLFSVPVTQAPSFLEPLRLILRSHEIATGTIHQDWIVEETPPGILVGKPVLGAGGDTLLICLNRRAYAFDLRELPPAPVPLHFDHSLPVPELQGDAAIVLRHPVNGGTPPYRFSLPGEREGLSIHPDSGELTLDVPRMREYIRTALLDVPPFQTDKSQERIQTIYSRSRKLLGNGRETEREDFLVPLRLQVLVEDAAGEQIQTTYFPFVLMDRMELLNALQQKNTTAREASMTQITEKIQELAPPTAPRNLKVRALEERIRLLEETMDLMIQKMRGGGL